MSQKQKAKRNKIVIYKTVRNTNAPYRKLGQKIQEKYKLSHRFESVEHFACAIGWGYETIRRVFYGQRRTDLVEIVILASALCKNQQDFEETVMDWTKTIFTLIQSDIQPRWK